MNMSTISRGSVDHFDIAMVTGELVDDDEEECYEFKSEETGGECLYGL